VALRLKTGSEEAGYLAAIFPIPKVPTLVILKNGQLKEYIAAGTSKDDFTNRVQTALDILQPEPESASAAQETTPLTAPAATTVAPTTPSTASSATAPTPAQDSSEAEQDPEPQVSTASEISRPTPASSSTPQTTTESSSSSVHAVLAERAAKLNQQREEAKRKALEAYARKAKGKEKETDPESDDTGKYRTPEQKRLADDIKKRQKEAAEERKRILKRIEDDKADRRAAREAAVREPTSGEVAAALATVPATNLAKPSSSLTALVVRLSDGSTIRNRFPNTATLLHDVRKWVDENRKDDVNAPYGFRVVLSPTSTRVIEEAEEGNSLEDLGLSPSATLVLVPVQRRSRSSASGSGGLFSWLYALILSFFSTIFSSGPPPNPAPEEIEMRDLGSQQQARTTGARVQTLHDTEQRRRRDHQLYNGNSVCLITIFPGE